MKKKLIIILFILGVFTNCSSEENEISKTSVTIKFTHNWNGTPVTQLDFNDFKFTNDNGEKLSLERLRYLLSKITLTNSNNEKVELKNYQIINLEEATSLKFKTNNITIKNYKLSFTFGFSDTDNIDGIYQDLNTLNFNVPGMLGGGYHFMQFDGKYKDINNQEQPFNYHAIRAVDRSDPNNLIFQDTSFLINLGNVTITNNAEIEIKMNISEWFKNPNTWSLNQLNTVLMPNFDAQKLMSENGKSVFSLGSITHY